MTNPALRITATGNAGFCIEEDGFTCAIDALWNPPLRRLGHRAPWAPPRKLDLVLVTHTHWDHFDGPTVRRAMAPSTILIGPPGIATSVGRAPAAACVEASGRGEGTVAAGPARVTWFRTTHGSSHVSYLLDVGGFRLFHDGDNEDTRPLPAGVLRPLDALMLCPWQGSGWEDFVRAVDPRWWLVSHLSPEEIEEHREGRFLPSLSDRVPLAEKAKALAPGESLELTLAYGRS